MSTALMSKVRIGKLNKISLFEISIVIYDKGSLIDKKSFVTNGTKTDLNTNLDIIWSDTYNNKDEYLIIMKDMNSDQGKRLVLEISDLFKDVVSINKSYISVEINSLYRREWNTYTIIER